MTLGPCSFAWVISDEPALIINTHILRRGQRLRRALRPIHTRLRWGFWNRRRSPLLPALKHSLDYLTPLAPNKQALPRCCRRRRHALWISCSRPSTLSCSTPSMRRSCQRTLPDMPPMARSPACGRCPARPRSTPNPPGSMSPRAST